MKHLPTIAGVLLGLLFLMFGLNFFFPFLPAQAQPPAGSPPSLFMGALYPTGYLAFVKLFEISGGLLCLFPKTRALGLLLLGPVIVNILAFHVFLANGAGLTQPPVLAITVLSLFLVWTHRAGFLALFRTPASV